MSWIRYYVELKAHSNWYGVAFQVFMDGNAVDGFPNLEGASQDGNRRVGRVGRGMAPDR